MAIGDEAGMETLKLLEKRLPHILGAESMLALVTESIKNVERRLPHVLGAPDVRTLVSESIAEARRELDQLMTEHRNKLRDEVIDHSISRIRREANGLLTDETELLVQKIRIEAERLVHASLEKTTKEAEAMIGTIANAITEQRTGARVDIATVAVTVRKELAPIVIWAAVIVGLMNAAGILAGAMLFR